MIIMNHKVFVKFYHFTFQMPWWLYKYVCLPTCKIITQPSLCALFLQRQKRRKVIRPLLQSSCGHLLCNDPRPRRFVAKLGWNEWKVGQKWPVLQLRNSSLKLCKCWLLGFCVCYAWPKLMQNKTCSWTCHIVMKEMRITDANGTSWCILRSMMTIGMMVTVIYGDGDVAGGSKDLQLCEAKCQGELILMLETGHVWPASVIFWHCQDMTTIGISLELPCNKHLRVLQLVPKK